MQELKICLVQQRLCRRTIAHPGISARTQAGRCSPREVERLASQVLSQHIALQIKAQVSAHRRLLGRTAHAGQRIRSTARRARRTAHQNEADKARRAFGADRVDFYVARIPAPKRSDLGEQCQALQTVGEKRSKRHRPHSTLMCLQNQSFQCSGQQNRTPKGAAPTAPVVAAVAIRARLALLAPSAWTGASELGKVNSAGGSVCSKAACRPLGLYFLGGLAKQTTRRSKTGWGRERLTEDGTDVPFAKLPADEPKQ